MSDTIHITTQETVETVVISTQGDAENVHVNIEETTEAVNINISNEVGPRGPAGPDLLLANLPNLP